MQKTQQLSGPTLRAEIHTGIFLCRVIRLRVVHRGLRWKKYSRADTSVTPERDCRQEESEEREKRKLVRRLALLRTCTQTSQPTSCEKEHEEEHRIKDSDQNGNTHTGWYTVERRWPGNRTRCLREVRTSIWTSRPRLSLVEERCVVRTVAYWCAPCFLHCCWINEKSRHTWPRVWESRRHDKSLDYLGAVQDLVTPNRDVCTVDTRRDTNTDETQGWTKTEM